MKAAGQRAVFALSVDSPSGQAPESRVRSRRSPVAPGLFLEPAVRDLLILEPDPGKTRGKSPCLGVSCQAGREPGPAARVRNWKKRTAAETPGRAVFLQQ